MAGPDIELVGLSTTRLLRLYAALLSELINRQVVRTRNAPAGDLAETLVARAYGGELAAKSEKSWDVSTPDGRYLQVKCRLVGAHTRSSQVFSPFRSWGFDACVFVLLNSDTYAVDSAVEVPVDVVRDRTKEVKWVAGHRVRVQEDFLSNPRAIDVTNALRAALAGLDNTETTATGEPRSTQAGAASGTPSPKPTGECLCGCGGATRPGKWFVASHDRRAESQIIREHYGSVAQFVLAHRGGRTNERTSSGWVATRSKSG